MPLPLNADGSPQAAPQGAHPKSLARRIQTERKARGQTQSEVAALLGVARTTIVAVEKGERALAPSEAVRLAKAWGMAVSDLVRERAASEPLSPQLRAAAPAHRFKDSEIADLGASAEKLRVLGESYLELEELLGRPLKTGFPTVYEAGAMPPVEAAEDIAGRERQRLGLSDSPIPHLRSVLENEVGLRVFLLPMPSRVAGMFAFDEVLGACVALNIQHPAERRLWTLAHEYFHFLAERYKADVCPLPGAAPRRPSDSEKMADAFAARFLMPASGLRRRFYDIKSSKTDGGVTPGDLLHLKRQYGVSFAALLLRLEELGLVRAGTLKMLQDGGFAVREAEAMAGLSAPEREEALPERMRVLAVAALLKGQISEGRAARLLSCDRLEVRRIVDSLAGEDEVSDEGERAWLEIPLQQILEGVA